MEDLKSVVRGLKLENEALRQREQLREEEIGRAKAEREREGAELREKEGKLQALGLVAAEKQR